MIYLVVICERHCTVKQNTKIHGNCCITRIFISTETLEDVIITYNVKKQFQKCRPIHHLLCVKHHSGLANPRVLVNLCEGEGLAREGAIRAVAQPRVELAHGAAVEAA